MAEGDHEFEGSIVDPWGIWIGPSHPALPLCNLLVEDMSGIISFIEVLLVEDMSSIIWLPSAITPG